jgi:hypothetical protein
VEECREIFVDRVNDHESGQHEHKLNSGNESEDYHEDTRGGPKLYNGAMHDASITAMDPGNSTNKTAKLEQYQGQEINTLFDDKLSHMFLQDWDGSISTWEAKVVRRFFSGEHDKASRKADRTAWAWLHDRECSTGHRRTYQSKMGAKDLCSALRRQVLPAFTLDIAR